MLGLGFIGAAWVVRQRKGRKLRKPTTRQLDGMGEPLGAILARHVPAHLLNADLADLVKFGGALGAYATDGNLTLPNHDEPALPDLTTTQEF